MPRGWRLLGLMALLLIGLSAMGCGQKGPLYLPKENGMMQKVN
ncbi:LPS translocon maturation chaperone LptM [Nitrosococcus oceani]